MNMHRHSRILMMAEAPPGGGGNPPAPGPAPGAAPPAFTFGDAHKDYVTAKGWKGVDDVITSNRNLETLLGADKAGRAVIWPKDATDADGWKAINAKLGVPEKADDYQLPLYEGATEPDAFQKALVVELHKNGVPKSAAQALAKFVNDYDKTNLANANTAHEQKSTADLAALKTEWGTAHDANHGLAVTLMGHMGFTQEDIASMSKNADVLRKFHKGAAALGTKPTVPGEGGTGGVTQAQALEQLNAAREKRNKGEMSAEDWFAIMDRLGPIAGGS